MPTATCNPSDLHDQCRFSVGRVHYILAQHLMAVWLRLQGIVPQNNSLKTENCSNIMDHQWRSWQRTTTHQIWRGSAPCHSMGADVGILQSDNMFTQIPESASLFQGKNIEKGMIKG